MHDFIQDLFKEGCADPEVFDGLRRQVGQLRHLAHILWDALNLISSLEVKGKKTTSSLSTAGPEHSWLLVGHRLCPPGTLGTGLQRLLPSPIPTPIPEGPHPHLKTEFTKSVSNCKGTLGQSLYLSSPQTHTFSTRA